MAKRWLILKRDEEGVSPVIATILMVAITVVLAAVLYVMVSGLISGPGTSKPQVTFSSQDCSGVPPSRQCTASVAGASQTNDLNKYKIVVTNTTGGGNVQAIAAFVLDTSAHTGTGAYSTLSFRYTDLGSEGRLNSGDTFTLSGVTASGLTFKASLLWGADNSEIQAQVWNT